MMGNFQSRELTSKNGCIVQIRHLSNGDEQLLDAFYRQAAIETKHTLVCPERLVSLDRLKEKIENAEKSSSELYLGVFSNTKVIGSLQFRVTIPDHPWAKHLGEFGMIVLQEYWNQGIGRNLLSEMERFALQIGVCRIEAKVRANNLRAIHLYQSAGYKIEGIRERGAWIDSQFVDEFFIAKIL